MDRAWHGIALPQGVEVLENKGRAPQVCIRFTYKGQKVRELFLPANSQAEAKESIKTAAQKMGAVQLAMKLGNFNFGEMFPNSKNCAKFGEFHSTGITVGALIDEYLKRMRPTDKRKFIERSTFDTYRRTLECYVRPKWGKLAPELIASTAVRAWVVELMEAGLQKRSVNGILSPLHRCLDRAVSDGRIKANPFRGVMISDIWPLESRKLKSKADPFSPSERAAILKVANDEEKRMCLFWWHTGLRPEEFIAVKWEDVDWEDRSIHIQRVNAGGVIEERTKTYSGDRRIPLFPITLEALQGQRSATQLKPHGFIWENFHLRLPYNTTKSLSQDQWKGLIKRAGIRYRSPRQNRHTFATTMIANGEDIQLISEWMGHANTQITYTAYSRAFKDRDSAGKRVLKLKGDYTKAA